MSSSVKSVRCFFFRVILVVWASCLVVLPGKAQPGVRLDSIGKRIYQTALRSGDYGQAVQAIQMLIALDEKSSYRDSLVRLYFQLQQPVPALYWSEELLKEGSADSLVLQEIRARSLQSVNDVKGAIAVWEQLTHSRPDEASYWWELGKSQYSLRRQAEALVTLGKLDALQADSTRTVAYHTPDDKQWRYTSVLAAAQNLKGIILYEMKQPQQADQAFRKALQLDPSYREAALNQAALEVERLKETKTPARGRPVASKG